MVWYFDEWQAQGYDGTLSCWSSLGGFGTSSCLTDFLSAFHKSTRYPFSTLWIFGTDASLVFMLKQQEWKGSWIQGDWRQQWLTTLWEWLRRLRILLHVATPRVDCSSSSWGLEIRSQGHVRTTCFPRKEGPRLQFGSFILLATKAKISRQNTLTPKNALLWICLRHVTEQRVLILASVRMTEVTLSLFLHGQSDIRDSITNIWCSGGQIWCCGTCYRLW